MRSLEISHRAVGPVTVVDLRGRLSLEEERPFSEAIRALVEAGHHQLVLEVGDLTLIDSAGIGALVAACVRSRRRGGDVKLLRLNDRNRHALEVTRLDSVFQAFDAEEAAVASFGGASLP